MSAPSLDDLLFDTLDELWDAQMPHKEFHMADFVQSPISSFSKSETRGTEKRINYLKNTIRTALDRGADITAEDFGGESVLCYVRDKDFAKELMDRGASAKGMRGFFEDEIESHKTVLGEIKSSISYRGFSVRFQKIEEREAIQKCRDMVNFYKKWEDEQGITAKRMAFLASKDCAETSNKKADMELYSAVIQLADLSLPDRMKLPETVEEDKTYVASPKGTPEEINTQKQLAFDALDKGANPNIHNENGDLGLVFALDTDVTRRMIEKGARVENVQRMFNHFSKGGVSLYENDDTKYDDSEPGMKKCFAFISQKHLEMGTFYEKEGLLLAKQLQEERAKVQETQPPKGGVVRILRSVNLFGNRSVRGEERGDRS